MCLFCDNLTQEQLDSLVSINCCRCPNVTSLPPQLASIKLLIIRETNITTIPSYPSLECLFMMDTRIESLPDLPKLKKLNANNSSLKTLPDTLFRLEHLSIESTQIETIPDTLYALIVINANKSKLNSVPDELVNLVSLSAASTNIEALPELLSLEYVDVSNTAVTEFDLDLLPSIRKIYASGCSLKDPFAIIQKGINLTN